MHYPPYWLRTDLDRKIAHAHLIKNAEEAGEAFATLTAVHNFEGVTEIVLYTPDHPRLLSTIAAACVAAKSDIVGAQIHTTATGKALDTILIRQEFEQEADERRRAERIAATLESALKGDVHLPAIMAEKGKVKGRVKAFKVPPEVMIDNQGSERFTVIEAAGRDRPGLLHDLASALADLSLDTHSAHVATFGERVVDVFYVTDLMGQKVTRRAKLNAIKSKLEDVLGGTPAKPRPAALLVVAVAMPLCRTPPNQRHRPQRRARPGGPNPKRTANHGIRGVSLLRNFATVGGATLSSRVLGFVRDILMAAALGTGPVADAFVVAFRFPNLFRRLFAEGAFNSAFVPLFARTLGGRGPRGCQGIRAGGDGWPVDGSGARHGGRDDRHAGPDADFGTGLHWRPGKIRSDGVSDPDHLPLSDPGFHLGADIGRVERAWPVRGGSLCADTAQCGFDRCALGLAGCRFGRRGEAGMWLAIGVVIGGFAQLALVIGDLHRAGFLLKLVRPRWSERMKRLVSLGVPGIIAGGITQINIVVGTMIASLQAGAVSLLYYADRLYQLPLGVVGIAIGVVLLPELSRRLKAGDEAGVKVASARSLEFAMLLTLPAAVALAAIPVPLVSVLFERGAFSEEARIGTAAALQALPSACQALS
jgi:hypothetical protein